MSLKRSRRCVSRRLSASTSAKRSRLSANKCVLRRVSPDVRASWHQDGAFLGSDIRTVDVWVALSRIAVATRMPLASRSCRGDSNVWSEPTSPIGKSRTAVTSAELARALDGLEPQTPTFAPGDAMLFDHLMLHTTASRPGLKRERYALETWIFTPSTFPAGYVPLAL